MLPSSKLETLQSLTDKLGRRLVVDYDNDGETAEFTVSFEGPGETPVPTDTMAMAKEVAEICCQIEISGFEEDSCSGRMIISSEGVFHDGSSNGNDWSYESFVDLDYIDEYADEEPADSPS